MNVRKMTRDDLELLSFTDIAYNIIKLDKKPKTTIELFKEICELLDLSEQEFEGKIADFFTSLTVDKRFILLDKNWDLKENHSVKLIIDESEDDFEDLEEEDLEELDDAIVESEEGFIEEDNLDDIDAEDVDELDDDNDELEDLELIDEPEEEAEE